MSRVRGAAERREPALAPLLGGDLAAPGALAPDRLLKEGDEQPGRAGDHQDPADDVEIDTLHVNVGRR